MNQPSVFQAQYPLSPKKYWKKMIEGCISWFVVLVAIFIFISVLVMSSSNSDFSEISFFLSGSGIFFLVYFLFICLPNSIYIKAYIKRYYYDCGEQFITIKKGVFAPTEIHVQYQKIQDVYVDQDIVDRMMGLYDVHIASATVTSGIEAHVDGVSFEVAESLKNIILSKINNSNGSVNPVQQQVITPQTQQSQEVPVQFDQKISSETYPISGSWIMSAIASSITYSIFYTFLIFLFFVRSSKSDLPNLTYVVLSLGIIFFLHLIYLSIWKQNYYFEFAQDYIILRTGVISRSENHLPYKSIQNILNSQGVFDRFIGLSTVIIQNAAQQMVGSGKGQSLQNIGISLVWQPKEKAEELNSILNDIVAKINPQNSRTMGV